MTIREQEQAFPRHKDNSVSLFSYQISVPKQRRDSAANPRKLEESFLMVCSMHFDLE